MAEHVAVPPGTAPLPPGPSLPPEHIPPANPAPASPALPTPPTPGFASISQAAKPVPDDATARIAELEAQLAAAKAPKPAAAPATPAADGTLDLGDLNNYDIGSIQDPATRATAMALKAMAGGDVDLNQLMGNAVAYGDPRLIDQRYLAEKFPGDKAQAVKGMLVALVDAVNQEATKAEQAVFSVAGGEPQWRAAAASFDQGAPSGLKAAVASMLNSGHPTNIAQAAEIIVQFAQGSGFVPVKGATTIPTATGGAGNVGGLSSEEFKAQLRTLNPNAADYSRKIQELEQLRVLGKRAGR